MTVELHRRHIEAPDFIDIGEERVSAIVQTIRWGWDRILKDRARAGTDEVELNEMLRDGMREEVNERSGNQYPYMTVLQGSDSRSTPDRARPDGRTDIPIQFGFILAKFHYHDPHAIIECKRVSGDDAGLCWRYVEEGIERFRHGKYAAQHAAGFMVGYLESGNADLAVLGINRRLERDGRESERLGPGVAVEAEWSRHSRHPREGGAAPIDLHHAFLAFSVGRS